MGDTKNKIPSGGVFDAEDISLFCAQLTLILKSGISIYDGVCAINENIKNPKAHKILKQMEEDLSVNMPFHEALRNCGAFPLYMVNMIEIGEKSGNLDTVIDSLSTYYNRESQLKKNIKSAVMYPSILVIMMSVVIAVLVMKVLPVFTQVFESLGGEMSASSTVIMGVGMNIARYAFIIIIALAIIFVVLFIYSKTKNGASVFSKFFSNFAMTRKLVNTLSSARLASVMSMMISSGFTTDEALEMSANIVLGNNIKKKIEICRNQMTAGKSFSEALEEAALFPGIYQQMVSIGVKTGSLDSVMTKLADIYNEEVDNSIAKAISFIEPCLVGILSLIIGAILLSVMLPLMGIMTSIG